jgi:hypothetical protein
MTQNYLPCIKLAKRAKTAIKAAETDEETAKQKARAMKAAALAIRLQ